MLQQLVILGIVQIMIVSSTNYDWKDDVQLGFYHYMNQMYWYGGYVLQPIKYSHELANVYSVTFHLRKNAFPTEIIYAVADSLQTLSYKAQEVIQKGMEAGTLNVGCRREDALDSNDDLYTCNFFNYWNYY